MNDDKLNSRYAIRVSDEDYLRFISLPMFTRRRVNEEVRALWVKEVNRLATTSPAPSPDDTSVPESI
jgi:hypothetical protein